jgi:hypothetical protein
MEYFGFYVQVLRGETFQQNTDNGKMSIDDFAAGETKEFGKIF